MKYGKEIFQELEEIEANGFLFGNQPHKITVVCCCDWKAGACIEGLNSATAKFFCRYCFCTKDQMKIVKGT